jgi:hypothetical protein
VQTDVHELTAEEIEAMDVAADGAGVEHEAERRRVEGELEAQDSAVMRAIDEELLEEVAAAQSMGKKKKRKW